MKIWRSDDGGVWKLAAPEKWELEETLHSLVDKNPEVLPLAGEPALVVVGREIPCGSGRADLVAIDDTARLVLMEVKLKTNDEARRAVVAQLLSYAAYLRGIGVEELDDLLASELRKRSFGSVIDAAKSLNVAAAVDVQDLRRSLSDCLSKGSFRLVFILDDAPKDLVRVVGYLESISGDSVSIDLVTVAKYQIGDSQILVPQRVDPERLPEGNGGPRQSKSVTVKGVDDFIVAITDAPAASQPLLTQMTDWARGLEEEGLAVLYTSHGKGRKTLVPRVMGDDVGLCTVWNDNGAYLSLHRTVFERLAPVSLPTVEEVVAPYPLGRGTVVHEVTPELLSAVREAYLEAVEGAV